MLCCRVLHGRQLGEGGHRRVYLNVLHQRIPCLEILGLRLYQVFFVELSYCINLGSLRALQPLIADILDMLGVALFLNF